MKRAFFWFFLLILAIYSGPVQGQTVDSTLLSLETIFSSDYFSSDLFRQASWYDKGRSYTTLEASGDTCGGHDIVCYHVRTGERTVLVPATRLIPEGGKTPLSISDYQWSEDHQNLLIFTNTRRVWRANTRGDYWLVDLKKGNLRKLGKGMKPSSLMFATFSPDGEKIAYVSGNNLYVEEVKKEKIIQLTKDGSETTINGTFDWVYEEEFDLRNGFRWSPDSRRIAYWQLDARGVGIFYLINNTDSLYSRPIPVQYPKAGTTNSSCRIGVVDAAGGDSRWFMLEGSPRDHYIAYMEWAGPDEIIFQRLNRMQNTLHVMLGDVRKGTNRIVLTEKDSTWVDVVTGLEWIDDMHFTWVSERDGWRHVYRISKDGKDILCLTPGDYDVVSVQHIDKTRGWLFFIASPDNPTQRYLYRVPMDGSGRLERLTPETQGVHYYDISPDGEHAFHTHSSFGVPPVTELISVPDHSGLRVLAENGRLKKRVGLLRQRPVEFFKTDIGDATLYGWCMKPFDFDPSKKYPVLFYVYGEPWGQTVIDRWGGTNYLWHLMLTQKGYLVMSIDNRGTPLPLGREWRKIVYRQVGILASKDQAEAVKRIGRWSFVDSTRFAIWGWSGGGSMSLNAIFRYPRTYQTAMSVAPVPDEYLYDTIYQERYMGLPETNPLGYKNGSPLTFAHQLEGNLLVVHGTGDDNVHYQGTERLINELVRHNKPFTMMAYPNRSHGIYEGENTTRHLFELLTRYLTGHTPPGPADP